MFKNKCLRALVCFSLVNLLCLQSCSANPKIQIYYEQAGIYTVKAKIKAEEWSELKSCFNKSGDVIDCKGTWLGKLYTFDGTVEWPTSQEKFSFKGFEKTAKGPYMAMIMDPSSHSKENHSPIHIYVHGFVFKTSQNVHGDNNLELVTIDLANILDISEGKEISITIIPKSY